MAVRISGTGSYAPPTVWTNDDLAEAYNSDIDPAWTERVLGIQRRHFSIGDETTADMTAEAGRLAIAQAGLMPIDIDMIIVATTTPDRVAPSVASEVQRMLGCRCAAVDVGAVCSGFLYGLAMGAQFIENSSYDYVLVISADMLSRHTDWTSRDCVFFGDGAGAVALDNDLANGRLVFNLGADGSGTEGFHIEHDGKWHMDGPAVYKMAVKRMADSMRNTLGRAGLATWEVDHVIPHQPSRALLRQVANETGIPFSKFHTNMAEYANTGAATVPLLLDEVNRAGKLQAGDVVLFVAAGAGWTWGSAVITWA